MNDSAITPKKFGHAAAWLILSIILFLMASISTVESLSVYYIQLACFATVSVACIVTGIAYALGKPWANILAKYLKWILGIYFIGSLLIFAMFVGFKSL